MIADNFTKKVRTAVLTAFLTVVGAALVGWLVGRDPEQLVSTLTVLVMALGVGEVSNVGKRFTTKATHEGET